MAFGKQNAPKTHFFSKEWRGTLNIPNIANAILFPPNCKNKWLNLKEKWKKKMNKIPKTNPRQKPINHYFLGAQFLKYCVQQGWLKQEGSGNKGTRWYSTTKGKEILKEKFGIDI